MGYTSCSNSTHNSPKARNTEKVREFDVLKVIKATYSFIERLLREALSLLQGRALPR
jgi:hypothetical protein